MTDVLIIGAGPTGLVLALWLARQGISFRIVDQAAEPGQTSRAIVVQARTLEFYHQLGISDDVIKHGIKVENLFLRSKNKKKGLFSFKEFGLGLSPFPYILSFPQDDHEKLLIAHLKKHDVEVERNAELQSFTQNPNHVTAVIKTGDKVETIEAKYLCGCDGAKSATRHLLNIDFPGGTYNQIFFVADVETTELTHLHDIEVSLSGTDFCIVFPVRSSKHHRLIGLVPKDKENLTNITFEDVKPSVLATTDVSIKNLNWFSVYHVHHRVARVFAQNRIFLLGDAAHIHSPAGGQGMNTGIGDAINLAWKLVDVLQNKASANLLNTYEPERLSFAKILLRSTDQMFQFISARTKLGKFWRIVLAPNILVFIFKFNVVRRFFFRTLSQIKIKYRESSLSAGKAGKVQGGDRLPWIRMGDTDNFAPLQNLSWQIHVYGEATESFRSQANKSGIPVFTFPWQNNMAEYFEPNAVYLIRPDGYVSVACPKQNFEVINDMIQKFGL